MKSSKSTILRISLLSLLTGFITAQWISWNPLLPLISTVFLITTIQLRNSKNTIFLVSIIGLCLSLSITYSGFQSRIKTNPLNTLEGENVLIQGTITSFPDQRIKNNRNYLHIKSINQSPVTGKQKILLVTKPTTILHYGDTIEIKGKLSKPRNFKDFNYIKYLDRFGASHIIKFPSNIEVLDKNGGWVFLKTAEQIRIKLEQNLEQLLPSPHSTIAMGILLGVKKELPPPIQKDFQDSGLMHILVVSGFNISVIMILCNFLLRRFGPRINILGSIIIVLFFVLMTGSEAPVVRAAIMGSLVGVAVSNGRFSESRNIVLLSAVIIGLINPKVVQTDLGFFFSFAATLGIILLVPILTPYFQWLTNRFEFRNIFLVTLSSQIAIFPLQTYFFEAFPTGGLLANQLTEPIIPLAMLFSSLISILGFFPDIILRILSIPAWFCLQILLSVANIFSLFPTIQIHKSFALFTGIILISFILWANISPRFQEEYLLKKKNVIR